MPNIALRPDTLLEVVPVVTNGEGDVITKGVPFLVTLADLTANAPAATAATAGVVNQAVVQEPAAAGDVAALKTQFDALLVKLKDAGLMASE